jgi:hypothetical protein
MDSELLIEKLGELFDSIKDGSGNLKKLESLLKKIDKLDDPYEAIMECEDYFSEWINDSEWRSDEIGDEAITDPKVFELVFQYICPHDPNIEVVLARSPNCPQALISKLELSDYGWEEDGTTQALARNQNDVGLLTRLAENPDPSTRYYVASNPSTTVTVLTQLAKDNGYSPSLVFMNKFDEDPNRWVYSLIKFAVMSNPNTSQDILEDIYSQLSVVQDGDLPNFISKEEVQFLMGVVKERLNIT